MNQEIHMRAFIETISSMTLDDYQVSFLNDCLNFNRVVGIFSRQTGKTTILSLFSIYRALQTDNYKILIVAPTDRQAGELFSRIREFGQSSGLVQPFITNCTLREMKFNNGSYIRAMPTGDFGNNIRGQTANLIILEESSYIKSSIVGKIIVPMISSRGNEGCIIQIGTPWFKNHFFNATLNDKYKVHQYDYTYCPRITKEFIDEQIADLTSMEFAMEYMAQFISDTDCYFPDNLINNAIKDYSVLTDLREVMNG